MNSFIYIFLDGYEYKFIKICEYVLRVIILLNNIF